MDLRYVSQYYDGTPTPTDFLELEKFKIKDPQANDVFQRKVIYELKRENDILRRELSGAGGRSTYSMNEGHNILLDYPVHQPNQMSAD